MIWQIGAKNELIFVSKWEFLLKTFPHLAFSEDLLSNILSHKFCRPQWQFNMFHFEGIIHTFLNPKHEARNPKQIQKSNVQNPKQINPVRCQLFFVLVI